MKRAARVFLADQIRQLIRDRKLSQRQIARETGIKLPGLSKLIFPMHCSAKDAKSWMRGALRTTRILFGNVDTEQIDT